MVFIAVAASFAVKSRLSAMRTVNRVEAATDGALVDGAVLFSADALRPAVLSSPSRKSRDAPTVGQPAAAPASPKPDVAVLPVDGRAVACATGRGARLEIRVVDQGGLLDLNAAPVAMLQTFLDAAGLEAATGRRLADEIADFRDVDDDPQSNGIKESAQYAQENLPWGPRNAPFSDPAEFGQLPSATPAIVARLMPMLTIANPRASLDLGVMDRAARGKLPRDAARSPEIKRWLMPSKGTDFVVEARLRRDDGSLTAGRRALVGFKPESGALRIRQWEGRTADDADWLNPARNSVFCTKLALALGVSRS
ncbi:general secretion pathway protein K [Aureimonas pseudogalii]|uniref:General secretion pathway protein K n=2 Tax=Aureimonas pseudogalii TaxID=1744844 RepID=A0A7W6MMC5_9HYPH|nr:general secretion pathway protein K [Aureimonas pseudogalii]